MIPLKFSLRWGVLLALAASGAFAESVGGGRGGPFLQYHTASLAQFDGEIKGNPVVVGGMGFGFSSRTFRVGGAGGAGFLWGPSDNVQFGMGYGGIIGEFIIVPWLSARMLVGGGGYAVSKVAADTPSQQTLDKLGSGGFFLFHPGVNADITLNNMMKLGISAGYFLPNIGELQSFTLTFCLSFGRT